MKTLKKNNLLIVVSMFCIMNSKVANISALSVDDFASDNYYELLGVSPNATVAEISSACKGKAKLYHPDKHFGEEATYNEIISMINNACTVLKDDEQRALYNTSHNIIVADDKTPAAEEDVFTKNEQKDVEEAKILETALDADIKSEAQYAEKKAVFISVADVKADGNLAGTLKSEDVKAFDSVLGLTSIDRKNITENKGKASATKLSKLKAVADRVLDKLKGFASKYGSDAATAIGTLSNILTKTVPALKAPKDETQKESKARRIFSAVMGVLQDELILAHRIFDEQKLKNLKELKAEKTKLNDDFDNAKTKKEKESLTNEIEAVKEKIQEIEDGIKQAKEDFVNTAMTLFDLI